MHILKGLICFSCLLVLIVILLPIAAVCGALRGIAEDVPEALEKSMEVALDLRRMMASNTSTTNPARQGDLITPQPPKEQ